MACAAGNELKIKIIYIKIEILRVSRDSIHCFYHEYHYSPHKLAFKNIMRTGDQKLMINLEWPNIASCIHPGLASHACQYSIPGYEAMIVTPRVPINKKKLGQSMMKSMK